MTDQDSNAQVIRPDPPHTASTEAQVFKEAIGAFIEPLADAEKVKATEETKRFTIWVGLIRESFRWVYLLAFAIFSLVPFAYLNGDKEFAEKIIYALLGFVGGFGFGSRARGKPSD